MTRVSAFAVLFCAAMTLAVTEANAQCASCSQTATPVFAQSYAQAPMAVSYAAPVTYTNYAAPVAQTYTAMPAQGCSSCGTAAPMVQTYSAMPATQGCCAPAPTCCAPPAPTCCDPCASSGRVTLRDKIKARRAARTASKNCCDPCCG